MRKGYRWGLLLMLCLATVAVHSQVTLLTEDFNGSDPPGLWQKFNNSSGGEPDSAAWKLRPDGYTYSSFFVDPPRIFHSNDNSKFYLTNSDAQGDDAPPPVTNTILQSPSFSTTGYSFITLSFYHHFREALADTGYIEVSTDETNWTIKAKIFADIGDSVGAPSSFALKVVSLDVSNNPTVWIRFRYYAEFGYYWALDNVLVEGSIVTPVNLVSFSGYRAGTRNLLKWTTASEQNNLGFSLERSADGINYSSIGFVQSLAPSGNSVSSLDYFYSDNNLAGNKQYYRLRQADFDGHEKLSNVILIRGDNPSILSISSIFPNPARNNINVLISAPHRDNIILQVTDMNGRLVNQKNAVVEKGSNNINIDLAGLTNGTYFLKVIAESGPETLSGKFIKQ